MKRSVVASLLGSLLMIVSCAFDGGNTSGDPNDVREAKRHDKLQDIYESIKGNYEGTLVSQDPKNPQKTITEIAQLKISYYEVNTGRTDSKGQPVFEPRPFAKFVLPEADDLDANMDGSYDEMGGSLTLATRALGQSGFDGPRYGIQGSLLNRHFTGELTSPTGGVIGKLDLTWKNGEVLSPRRDDQEQYDRIKCWLRRVVGKYVGHVDPYDQDFKPFQVNLEFNLEDAVVSSPSGSTILPVLVARGRRADGLSVAWRYNVVYRDDLTPAQLNLTAFTGARGYADFSINSTYILDPLTREATMDGEINFPTFTGKFTAARVKGSEAPLDDCKK